MTKFQPSTNPAHFSALFEVNSGAMTFREDDEIVKRLQAINQFKDIDFNCWDGEYNSALYLATANGKNNTIKYLLDNGANIGLAVSDGLTPLHLAAHIGNVNALKMFLGEGLSYLCTIMQDDFGETPLFRAIGNAPKNVLPEVVKLLLKQDTRAIEIRNEDGILPIELALQRSDPIVVKLLLQNGATISNQLVRQAEELMQHFSKKVDNKTWILDKSHQKNNDLAECFKLILETQADTITFDLPKVQLKN